MKTEDLIAALAKGGEPQPRMGWARQLALALVAGWAVAASVMISLGVRPDIGVAMLPVLLKAGFSAAAAAIMLPLVARLMRPGRPLGWRIGAAALFFAVCALAVIVALMGVPPEHRMRAWIGGGGFVWCLVLIPVLAVPSAALLTWVMRAFAPTRLTLTGAAIGAVSGAIGAMAYAMSCRADSVVFVVSWYALAIALCAALGALLGAKMLKW